MADPDGVEAEEAARAPAEGNDEPPPDESFLLGRAGGEEQLLAELARAEAELHQPGIRDGDGAADEDAVV